MQESPKNVTPAPAVGAADAPTWAQVIESLKPKLPVRYTPIVRTYYPDIDAQRLRYALAGRGEYWEAVPGLRIAAGLDVPPRVGRLNVQPRKQAA